MKTLINPLGGGGGGSSEGSSTPNISFSISGKPADGQIIIVAIPDGITLTIAEDMEGSKGHCEEVPTAEVQFDVRKNNTSVGTITFALGASTPTFVAASEIELDGSNSDYLKIICPALQDDTFADIGITIKAS